MERAKKIVENGNVYEIDEFGRKHFIGTIASVDLDIEYSEKALGTSQIRSSVLYDENDNELLNDQDIAYTQTYFSDEDLFKTITERYNISKDLIRLS